MVSLLAQMIKNPTAGPETQVQSLGREDTPGGGHGNPLQYPCLENPHGQRSLAGYSPWGLKESHTIAVTNSLLLSCGCLATTLQLLMDLRELHGLPWAERFWTYVTSLPQGTFDHVWRPLRKMFAPDTQWVETRDVVQHPPGHQGTHHRDPCGPECPQYRDGQPLPAPVGISVSWSAQSSGCGDFTCRAFDDKTWMPSACWL